MKASKIVLVLGAGASAEYGLPIGQDLRNWIVTSARQRLTVHLSPPPRNVQWRNIATGEVSVEDENSGARRRVTDSVTTFVQAFGSMGDATIDEFLALNPSHAEMGRLAIAQCLIERQDQALAKPDLAAGCYTS